MEWGGVGEVGRGKIKVLSDLGCSNIPVPRLTQMKLKYAASDFSFHQFFDKQLSLIARDVVTFFLKRKDEKMFLSKKSRGAN